MIEDVLCVICEAVFEIAAEAVGDLVIELLSDALTDSPNRQSFSMSFFSDEIISLDIFKSNKENL